MTTKPPQTPKLLTEVLNRADAIAQKRETQFAQTRRLTFSRVRGLIKNLVWTRRKKAVRRERDYTKLQYKHSVRRRFQRIKKARELSLQRRYTFQLIANASARLLRRALRRRPINSSRRLARAAVIHFYRTRRRTERCLLRGRRRQLRTARRIAYYHRQRSARRQTRLLPIASSTRGRHENWNSLRSARSTRGKALTGLFLARHRLTRYSTRRPYLLAATFAVKAFPSPRRVRVGRSDKKITSNKKIIKTLQTWRQLRRTFRRARWLQSRKYGLPTVYRERPLVTSGVRGKRRKYRLVKKRHLAIRTAHTKAARYRFSAYRNDSYTLKNARMGRSPGRRASRGYRRRWRNIKGRRSVRNRRRYSRLRRTRIRNNVRVRRAGKGATHPQRARKSIKPNKRIFCRIAGKFVNKKIWRRPHKLVWRRRVVNTIRRQILRYRNKPKQKKVKVRHKRKPGKRRTARSKPSKRRAVRVKPVKALTGRKTSRRRVSSIKPVGLNRRRKTSKRLAVYRRCRKRKPRKRRAARRAKRLKRRGLSRKDRTRRNRRALKKVRKPLRRRAAKPLRCWGAVSKRIYRKHPKKWFRRLLKKRGKRFLKKRRVVIKVKVKKALKRRKAAAKVKKLPKRRLKHRIRTRRVRSKMRFRLSPKKRKRSVRRRLNKCVARARVYWNFREIRRIVARQGFRKLQLRAPKTRLLLQGILSCRRRRIRQLHRHFYRLNKRRATPRRAVYRIRVTILARRRYRVLRKRVFWQKRLIRLSGLRARIRQLKKRTRVKAAKRSFRVSRRRLLRLRKGPHASRAYRNAVLLRSLNKVRRARRVRHLKRLLRARQHRTRRVIARGRRRGPGRRRRRRTTSVRLQRLLHRTRKWVRRLRLLRRRQIAKNYSYGIFALGRRTQFPADQTAIQNFSSFYAGVQARRFSKYKKSHKTLTDQHTFNKKNRRWFSELIARKNVRAAHRVSRLPKKRYLKTLLFRARRRLQNCARRSRARNCNWLRHVTARTRLNTVFATVHCAVGRQAATATSTVASAGRRELLLFARAAIYARVHAYRLGRQRQRFLRVRRRVRAQIVGSRYRRRPISVHTLRHQRWQRRRGLRQRRHSRKQTFRHGGNGAPPWRKRLKMRRYSVSRRSRVWREVAAALPRTFARGVYSPVLRDRKLRWQRRRTARRALARRSVLKRVRKFWRLQRRVRTKRIRRLRAAARKKAMAKRRYSHKLNYRKIAAKKTRYRKLRVLKLARARTARRRLPRKLWPTRRKRFYAYGLVLPRQRRYGTQWLSRRALARRTLKLILRVSKRLRKVVRRRVSSQRHVLVVPAYRFTRPRPAQNSETSYSPSSRGVYRGAAKNRRLTIRTISLKTKWHRKRKLKHFRRRRQPDVVRYAPARSRILPNTLALTAPRALLVSTPRTHLRSHRSVVAGSSTTLTRSYFSSDLYLLRVASVKLPLCTITARKQRRVARALYLKKTNYTRCDRRRRSIRIRRQRRNGLYTIAETQWKKAKNKEDGEEEDEVIVFEGVATPEVSNAVASVRLTGGRLMLLHRAATRRKVRALRANWWQRRITTRRLLRRRIMLRRKRRTHRSAPRGAESEHTLDLVNNLDTAWAVFSEKSKTNSNKKWAPRARRPRINANKNSRPAAKLSTAKIKIKRARNKLRKARAQKRKAEAAWLIAEAAWIVSEANDKKAKQRDRALSDLEVARKDIEGKWTKMRGQMRPVESITPWENRSPSEQERLDKKAKNEKDTRNRNDGTPKPHEASSRLAHACHESSGLSKEQRALNLTDAVARHKDASGRLHALGGIEKNTRHLLAPGSAGLHRTELKVNPEAKAALEVLGPAPEYVVGHTNKAADHTLADLTLPQLIRKLHPETWETKLARLEARFPVEVVGFLSYRHHEWARSLVHREAAMRKAFRKSDNKTKMPKSRALTSAGPQQHVPSKK